MLEVQTHLQMLELDSTASLNEIKQAYKDLVTVWHPDRFGHNPRLREKAEGKLKQFNQAYEVLRSWRKIQPAASSECQNYSTQGTGRSSGDRRSQPPHHSSPPHTKTQQKAQTTNRRRKPRQTKGAASQEAAHDLDITFPTAEFILQHYCFIGEPSSGHQCYQGGPFVLIACEDPPEVMLSVPCDSLRFFDRILLSIPCKSAGHFKQQEARRLLQLLHAQQ